MEQLESTVSGENTGIPKNLKTLGILSLIMGGLMFLGALWALQKHYMPSEQDKAMMEQQMEMLQSVNPAAYDDIAKTMESQGLQSILSLVFQGLSIVSVILMLKLKKTGFYLYIAAELLPYVCSIALVGVGGLMGPLGAMGESFKALGIALVAVMVILDIVFIYLYSKYTKIMS
jgi:hypothetical protein